MMHVRCLQRVLALNTCPRGRIQKDYMPGALDAPASHLFLSLTNNKAMSLPLPLTFLSPFLTQYSFNKRV